MVAGGAGTFMADNIML